MRAGRRGDLAVPAAALALIVGAEEGLGAGDHVTFAGYYAAQIPQTRVTALKA